MLHVVSDAFACLRIQETKEYVCPTPPRKTPRYGGFSTQVAQWDDASRVDSDEDVSDERFDGADPGAFDRFNAFMRTECSSIKDVLLAYALAEDNFFG